MTGKSVYGSVNELADDDFIETGCYDSYSDFTFIKKSGNNIHFECLLCLLFWFFNIFIKL